MNQIISIFGLGYVGAVTAGCLATGDRRVIGVDVQSRKVELLNSGKPTIGEPGLDQLIGEAKARGTLHASVDSEEAVRESGISLVCVGTPSLPDGGLDLAHVEQVSEEIRDALVRKKEDHGQNPPHLLVYRSTMLPGSTRRLLEKYFAELTAAGIVELYFYPEFLRQGNAVADFNDPRISVIGAANPEHPSDALRAILPPETRIVSLETAELLKYACNTFHAAKVAFANEMGRLGKAIGVDSRQVMEILCQDDRLNISPYYLRPGNPFGGSCLPKDVSALTQFAGARNLEIPLTDALIPSNDYHFEHLRNLVTARESRTVVILGLTFKPNTDDLRGSPLVRLAESLLREGYEVRIFDPWLNPDNLIGANEALAAQKLPQLSSLLQPSLADALGNSGTVLAANQCAEKKQLTAGLTAKHHVVDINGWPDLMEMPSTYEGFCW